MTAPYSFPKTGSLLVKATEAEEKQMKKKRKLPVLLSSLITVIVVVAVYLAIGFYFKDNFFPGTYVNSIYCTGKTVEEINTELKTLYWEGHFAESEVVVLQDASGLQYEIPLSDVLFGIDYISQLEKLKDEQNPLLWINGLLGVAKYNISPKIIFAKEALAAEIVDCGIRENNRHTDAEDAQLVEIRMEEGYTLFDGRKNVLDNTLVEQKVIASVSEGIYFVDVSDCYTDLPYTDAMQNTLSLFEKVDTFQHCDIIYDMGDEQIVLTPAIVSGFIALDNRGEFLLDEAGNLLWDEEAITAFIDTLCAEYDTYEMLHTFEATRGETVTIEGGTYGTALDREAELAYLLEALQNGESGIHVPTYEREAYHRGLNDIGNTYVEVDMTEQKLYFYREGEMLIETDIVTGNMRRGWDTPTGVNYVYALQRNRTLRGATYATFVKYWAPVVGNIGLHDASWRDKFGGDIYETGGSHGCINIPSEVMVELFEYLEIGMPVVMFY